jgi:hypothetical protein
MSDFLRYIQVTFKRFKAFESFTLNLRPMNIMVGPNNAGKSTILAAFRILEAGLRKARARKAVLVEGPAGPRYGYTVDFTALSIADENIFFNYDESEPASVTFSLTRGKQLMLYFPESRVCHLFVDDPKRQIRSPREFRSTFNCRIGFVPILGPVEQDETLYKEEAARLALFNYRAARNFRNIWHHYPGDFEIFQRLLRETWPGMDIQKPDPPPMLGPPTLHMFCTENGITREIAWVGFGFQVWCQMLTHLVKSRESSIFLIDEPDIYLHSDLQRRLLTLLAELGPDILIATHSTEIVSEADLDTIVLIDKAKRRAKRIKVPAQLHEVFSRLGSSLNPQFTQLAKTRCVVFVEGTDFRIFSKYARKLGLGSLANREQFAVIPIDGFNPERARNMKEGIERALGLTVRAAVVLDRDYRSRQECSAIEEQCRAFCELAIVHIRKEVESFVLVPEAIDRAARRRLAERARRTGEEVAYTNGCSEVLNRFVDDQKSYVMSQFTASRRIFVRRLRTGEHETTIDQETLDAFESDWAKGTTRRLAMMPAKEALSRVNQHLQEHYAVAVTATNVIDAMRDEEIPNEMRELLNGLAAFVAA